MLSTTHLIVGAATATIIPNPIISLPLAFFSHFILDLVPHWNWRPNTRFKQAAAVAEAFFGLILVFILIKNSNQPLTVLIAALAAILPDAIQGPYYFWGSKNAIVTKMRSFQRSHQGNLDLPWGLLIQIAIVAGLFFLLSNYKPYISG